MLLWVMGVEFENTCTVSGKWNAFSSIPDFKDGCKSLESYGSCSLESYGSCIVVITAGSHTEIEIDFSRKPIFKSPFMKFVLRQNQWDTNFYFVY